MENFILLELLLFKKKQPKTNGCNDLINILCSWPWYNGYRFSLTYYITKVRTLIVAA